ncbi:hypothetical protein MP228_009077 [Amoeboaphelidium protococcarum]|nr:hypothetical protein MP228_009077 [Amoeboaphelidium protococcarum]
MKAIQVSQTGGVEVLQVRDLPQPDLKPGQVLVRNHYSGVNFIDIYHRTGQYKLPLPFTPGREGAGVVERVSEDVKHIRVGDRVAYFSPGSYAEFTAANAAQTTVLPDGVSFEMGSVYCVAGLTSLVLSSEVYQVKQSDTVLIHAAAGGVGQILSQICKNHFKVQTVIGTTSSEEKAEIARKNGCDHVILYSKPGVSVYDEVMKITGGAGCNVVYDGVGKSTFDVSLDCVAKRGWLLLFGGASGPVPPLDILRLSKGAKNLARPSLMEFISTKEDFDRLSQKFFAMLVAGEVKIDISKVYNLENVSQAHSDLEGGKSTGKLVLKCA